MVLGSWRLCRRDGRRRRRKKPRSGRNCCDSNKDNAARTCKKLPVASFCASETAETERIASGREQGDHVGGDGSVLRPRFKALPEKILTEVSDGTSRNRFFAQNSGEKALNRCDAPALQRKDLERTAKEWPYAFVDRRLWLGGNGRWRVEKGCFAWW